MDGLLIVDKPTGPTSHDVVARVRRLLGESRVGHTGTLDPAASGVLPLVLGRATRLAQFLSQSDKVYEATITLGMNTDTCDALGQRIGPVYEGPFPAVDAVDRTLDAFRGSFSQQPPAFSAKKVDGRRSYKNARAARRLLALSERAEGERVEWAPSERQRVEGSESRGPAPVIVTTHAVDLLRVDGPHEHLRVHCSAGFYVRSLAHDLGERLTTGGHLSALRRTRSGQADIARAVPLEDLARDVSLAVRMVVPLGQMLPELPSLVLTPEGARRAIHGQDLGPRDALRSSGESAPLVRLLDAGGDLLAIAEAGRSPGLLHPFVVLK
jgi:tRNA pseudouridine55 synthase